MSGAAGPRWVAALGRVAVSLALLVAVGSLLDLGDVAGRLASLEADWVAIGLGLSVAQVVLLAWRWRFTAARLGIRLPLRSAVGEYYLGILLNQVLPGGVSGDVARAWRHARPPSPVGPAVRAVILERLSAQVVMTTVALASLLALPRAPGLVRGAGVGLVVLGSVAAAVAAMRRASGTSLIGRVWTDTHRALLARDALPTQLLTGALVVASYIAMYLVAARAIGIDTPTARLMPLVAPVLLTMLVPVTVAGWGIREGAAAALWGLVGLTPEDGVAISVAYGLLVLVASAPGGVVLTRALSANRSRRGHPLPGGSVDTPGAAPHPASPPDRG